MTDNSHATNRWLIAAMGTILQLCLGTVYAWSFFQNPLVACYKCSNAAVTGVFSIAICFLGIAAAWGGMNLGRFGPRKLAMTGAALFGAGYFIAAAAIHLNSLALLYIGYGVIGGIGLGLGYVTPVATIAKWFPDKKGLVTGMVVMGFGFGALLMSKILAPTFVNATTSEVFPNGDYSTVFMYLGAVLLAAALIAAAFLKNPPAGYAPEGYTVEARAAAGAGQGGEGPSRSRAILSGRFAMMWLVFFCNIAAGIAIISLQSPMMQELWKRFDPSIPGDMRVAYGATLIAVSSLFNGAGRFLWGGVSDRVGRVQTFRVMLATEIAAFIALIFTGNPWIFGGLICWVLLCYGGGFGTMPSFVLDVFGPRLMPVVYGVILTAWSAAGVAGPLMFAAIKDRLPLERASAWSFAIAAAILVTGLVIALAGLSDRPFVEEARKAA